MTPAPEPLTLLTADPTTTAIFCDFDGTLAEIVDDPATSRPVPGAVEVLSALAGSYGRIGVLSGRPLAFLEEFFGDGVVLAGLYGLEVRDGGQRRVHPDAERWRSVIDDTAVSCERSVPPGVRVEHKGLSVTLHYRGAPELADVVAAQASSEANRTGLVARPARMSVELHPPVAADKGTALRQAAAGMSTVAFIGDDVGDLPGFDALDELAALGVTTLRCAVRSEESPVELLDRAEVVLNGPEAVVGMLGGLVTSR